jgi:uncharacterized repeat protein (TIGR01451 family)
MNWGARKVEMKRHTVCRLSIVPVVTLAVVASTAIATASAAAATNAPRWAISADVRPSIIPPEQMGVLTTFITNSGGAPSNGEPMTVTDELPAGVTVVHAELKVEPNEETPPCEVTGATVTCTYSGIVRPDSGQGLSLVVRLLPEPGQLGALSPQSLSTVSGGGAAPMSAHQAVVVGEDPLPFEFSDFSAEALDGAGVVDAQAGSHPNTYVTNVRVNTVTRPNLLVGSSEFVMAPSEDIKDVVVDLPTGFVGNPQAALACPESEVVPPASGFGCPTGSIVGSIAIEANAGPWQVSGGQERTVAVKPLFNVIPSFGHPAQFAFDYLGQMATLYANLIHTGAGYVVQVASLSIPRFLDIEGVKVTFFGDPQFKSQTGLPSVPFFSNPTECSGTPLTTTAYMDSWTKPAPEQGGSDLPDLDPAALESGAAWHRADSVAPPVTGCEAVSFAPEFTLTPTTSQTSSPSGVNADLKIPQNASSEGLATADLKEATVTLPAGMTVSPSSANGLQACSDSEIDFDSTEPGSCPNASVIGTVRVHTPLLKEELEGHVYLGAPLCAPCSPADAQDGKLVRVFIEVANLARGVDVKIPGNATLDPGTGQLTAHFSCRLTT